MKKDAHIFSIACDVPPFQIEQEVVGKKIIEASNLDRVQAKRLERLYTKSEIATRYSVLQEYQLDVGRWPIAHNVALTTDERNAIYKKEAPKLAARVSKEALDRWGLPPEEISHLIFVSCTGIMAPGVQAHLIDELGLRYDVTQIGINMMGCFGALKALDVARAYAMQDDKNRILVISCELCTLHFQPDDNFEHQVGNALFGDGAACCIVGASPRKNETILYTIHDTKSMQHPHTLDKMTWELGKSGFSMGLSEELPRIIENNIAAFISRLLPENVSIDSCSWLVHPGGKAILEAVQKALNLSREHFSCSWHVLKHFGNMSSATFLFLLDEMKEKRRHPWSIGLAFGPGLVFEGIVLR